VGAEIDAHGGEAWLNVEAMRVAAGCLVGGEGEQRGVLVAGLVTLPRAEVEVLPFPGADEVAGGLL
jgi:hypothetical protein